MPTGRSESSRAAYHHGDLSAALVDTALELIEEKGARGFSVVEVARRTGVSTSAPYRHFADRDALLAGVAARAYGELLARFRAAIDQAPGPARQLAAIAAAYVRFAAERRAMFDVLFGVGLEKSRYEELERSSGEVIAVVMAVAVKLAPDRDEELAWALVQALAGIAHGHAALLLDGTFGQLGSDAATPESGDPVAIAERRVAAATRALLRGRKLLFDAA